MKSAEIDVKLFALMLTLTSALFVGTSMVSVVPVFVMLPRLRRLRDRRAGEANFVGYGPLHCPPVMATVSSATSLSKNPAGIEPDIVFSMTNSVSDDISATEAGSVPEIFLPILPLVRNEIDVNSVNLPIASGMTPENVVAGDGAQDDAYGTAKVRSVVKLVNCSGTVPLMAM